MSREYLGIGLKYPLEVINGSMSRSRDNDLIKQSIIQILTTPVGTRFFNPEFGSRLKELLFEPNDEVLEDLARVFIAEALSKWEKRVRFISANFTRDDSVFNIEITYSILQSNEIESLIFPFYKEAL